MYSYVFRFLRLFAQTQKINFFYSFYGKKRAVETRASINSGNLSNIFNSLYFVKFKSYKNELCQYLGCHFMIDDNIEILNNIKAHNSNIITILFEGENHPIHKCANNWNKVVKIINETNYVDSMISITDVSKLLY